MKQTYQTGNYLLVCVHSMLFAGMVRTRDGGAAFAGGPVFADVVWSLRGADL